MPLRVFPAGFGKNKPRMSATNWKRFVAKKRRSAMRRPFMKGASFAKKVLAVVNRQEETKYVATDLNSAGTANGAGGVYWNPLPQITNINSVVPAIPTISQGVTDFERIGQRISPKSLKVDLTFGMNPTDLSANSIMVVIWYGTSKESKSWVGGSPLSTISFLDNGQGGNQSWGGVRNQLNFPTDPTLNTLKRIVFPLAKSEGLQNQNGSSLVTQGAYSTSAGPSHRHVTLYFQPPKTLIYNKETDLYPTNYAPFYYIGFCNTDGSPANSVQSETLLNVSSRVHMRYKDS